MVGSQQGNRDCAEGTVGFLVTGVLLHVRHRDRVSHAEVTSGTTAVTQLSCVPGAQCIT
jgi:hypothetical protein